MTVSTGSVKKTSMPPEMGGQSLLHAARIDLQVIPAPILGHVADELDDALIHIQDADPSRQSRKRRRHGSEIVVSEKQQIASRQIPPFGHEVRAAARWSPGAT